MRADMHKVIVETSRSGSRMRWLKRDRRFLNSEEAPVKLGMHSSVTRSKWNNDHLGPLKRFLMRRAGRAWNDVYSEICAVIDRRSTVQEHVLLHIENFVVLRVARIDGRLYDVGGYRHTPLAELRTPLYVDPETGVLMRNFEYASRTRANREAAKRRAAELLKRRRILSAAEQLHRVGGLWYLVRVALLPETRIETRVVEGQPRRVPVSDPRWDVLLRKYASRKDYYAGLEEYGTRGLYAAAKRQLGRRELRRYGLR